MTSNLKSTFNAIEEDEFLEECKQIIDPVCNDFNISYAIEFKQDKSRFLEIRFANGSERAAAQIGYSALAKAEKPYLLVTQYVSWMINDLA